MVQPTPRALAERAAHLIAAATGSTDAVEEAARRLPAYLPAAVRWQLVAAVEVQADRIARSRHPMLADIFGAGPIPWACWQAELIEPWPILADSAARLGKALPTLTAPALQVAIQQ